ncbi:MAG: 50S ribosomal protein L18 [Candidatus Aenigmatarchaeota archaeon]
MFRRRREFKTDYRQRLGLLKSGKPRLVIRRFTNNIRIQIVKYEPHGDKTLIDEMTKNLRKFGWKGHCGNTPAAYLAGLIVGLKAAQKDIDSAVLDIGLHTSTKGSLIYAAALGAKDAGLKINLNNNIVPDIKRISGLHISNYAKLLKKDKEKYAKQFSQYIKNGLDPEKLPEHFEEVKKNILKEFGFTISKEGE